MPGYRLLPVTVGPYIMFPAMSQQPPTQFFQIIFQFLSFQISSLYVFSFNLQPSTFNLQPSTFNLQPSDSAPAGLPNSAAFTEQFAKLLYILARSCRIAKSGGFH